MRRKRAAAIAAAMLFALLLPSGVLGGQSNRTPAAPRAQYLVLIVMDGFRPDYMTQAPMRHLHALMDSGMTYGNAWVGQLEAQTPTGHATIATGAYPRKHGVVGFVWRDPTGQNISWMPTDLGSLNAGNMERQIEAGGVPSLSDEMHKRDRNATTASISGEKFYAADAMGTGADYIVYGDSFGTNRGHIVPTAMGHHIPPPSAHVKNLRIKSAADPLTEDQFSGSVALRLAATTHPRMLLINLPGADIEGHRSGGVTNPLGIHNVDLGIDSILARLMDAYKKAGIFKRTLWVVTADHGMSPNVHLIPRKAMYAAVRQTGVPTLEQDLLSTAGYIFLRDPKNAEHVATVLASKHFKYVEGAFYKVASSSGYSFRAVPQTSRSLGPALTKAYIDLCNTSAAFDGPDVVLPYQEDTLGNTVTVDGAHWGTHGGLSWRVQHIPLVISGPGVRTGTSAFPAKLVDIAPTVERLMGLSVPPGVDGVVLGTALDHPSSKDVGAQRSVSAARTRDVTALQRHSAAQHPLVLTKPSY